MIGLLAPRTGLAGSVAEARAGTGVVAGRAGSGGRSAATTGQPVPGVRSARVGPETAWRLPRQVLSASMGDMLRVLRLCSVFEPRELPPA
jgi:hypothetical protein